MADLLLIGCGVMALDYHEVLSALKIEYLVFGRGEKSASKFKEKTGKDVLRNGLESYIVKNSNAPKYAIINVGVEQLYPIAVQLLKYGIKEILIEKPAGINLKEVTDLNELAVLLGANIYVGYNRRFYESVRKARQLIVEDGGVTSFNFEFTEWSHVIKDLVLPKEVMHNWLLANSTHVIDMAFFMGGKPKEIKSFTNGSLPWHPSSSAFAGAGVTVGGALFSYQANWEAPGRWGVEMLTKQRRFIFRPLEKIQIQNIGSVAIDFLEHDYSIDTEFKPGLFKQVEAFLNGDQSEICMLAEQVENIKIYNQIAGY